MSLPHPSGRISRSKCLTIVVAFLVVLFLALVPVVVFQSHRFCGIPIERQQELEATTQVVLEWSPLAFGIAAFVSLLLLALRGQFLDDIRPKHNATINGRISRHRNPGY